MFLQCSYCERIHVFVFICNLFIEMSMEYLSLHLSISSPLLRNVMQTPFSLCSDSNVSLWEIQSSVFT